MRLMVQYPFQLEVGLCTCFILILRSQGQFRFLLLPRSLIQDYLVRQEGAVLSHGLCYRSGACASVGTCSLNMVTCLLLGKKSS